MIYFADNRDIPGYFDTKKRRLKYRRKKIQSRYTYSNPPIRIHGFTIVDDEPRLCRDSSQKYLSIKKIICANPFASKAGIKVVGLTSLCLQCVWHINIISIS